MTRRWFGTAILAGLVATPASVSHAQSNPWYIPPQPQQPSAGAPQHLPQAYTQPPQYGFGAGYAVQQQAPAVILVPAQPAQQGQVQQPPTTGALSAPAYGAPTPGTTYPQYQPANPAPTYQVPTYQVPTYQAPTYQAPTYQAPQPQYVPQQQAAPTYVAPQVQTAPVYQQPQVFGVYPPLGGDPTRPPAAPAQQQTPSAQPTAPPAAPSVGAGGVLQHPGFAGPSTLTPGYGAYPGLSPIYPAPLGASPYLGLPFY